jgi:integrase
MPRRNEDRLSLPLSDWPEPDRQALQRAREPAGFFARTGAAAAWKPKTARSSEKAYSLWLGCLVRLGLLDLAASPGARLTEANLTLFVRELQARVAPVTVQSTLRNLSAMIAAIDPAADRGALKQALSIVSADAHPRRRKWQKIVPPSVLFRAGIDRMERVAAQRNAKAEVQAGRYRDGLMLCILAARAPRLANLAAMTVGDQVVKVGEICVCALAPEEMKNGREWGFDLPVELTPYIDRYLAVYRPALLRGHQSDAFWISTYRGRMSEQTIYMRMRDTTKEEVGVEINPHLFRDCLATGVATEDPQHIGIVPHLLHHADERTAQRHYNQARSLSASRQLNDVLLDLRARALDMPEK